MQELSSFSFLANVSSFSQVNKFHFGRSFSNRFVGIDRSLGVPPLASVQRLVTTDTRVRGYRRGGVLPSEG